MAVTAPTTVATTATKILYPSILARKSCFDGNEEMQIEYAGAEMLSQKWSWVMGEVKQRAQGAAD